MGAYIMTQSLAGASLSGAQPGDPMAPRRSRGHPLVHLYRTRDDRWLALCFLQDRWFVDLARRMGREDLLDDARFNGEQAKMANAEALIGELQGEFETKTLAEWNEILFSMEGVWAPLLNPAEVIADDQALTNGFVTEVSADDGSYLAASSPGQFDERPIGRLSASPGYGEHTDEVMSELGLGADEISRLREQGILL